MVRDFAINALRIYGVHNEQWLIDSKRGLVSWIDKIPYHSIAILQIPLLFIVCFTKFVTFLTKSITFLLS